MERVSGWKPRFDDRSRRYGVAQRVGHQQPISKEWECNVVLDQGQEGSCVGHAWAHELAADPAPIVGVDHYCAVRLYWDAQRIDPWPGGEYPGAAPVYQGTSVISGAQACKEAGWIDSYHWGFGLDDLILGIGHNGPAVLGVPMYQGMYKPDRRCYIHPTGRRNGGHAILCRGVDIKKERFRLHNSWGPDWGSNGTCFISFRDMAYLLAQRAETCFPVGRNLTPRQDSYL